MGYQIININKDTHYEDWVNYRSSGIGASEVGTVMGLNPWKSSVELFYQKIGQLPSKIDENVAMFMGTRLEPVVANLWEHYDNDETQFIKNYNEGVKTRIGGEVVGYILNEKYPHLFLSPDRLILKKKGRLVYNGKLSMNNVTGVLEIKTISGFASKQWEGGIPPSYVVQLTTYLLGLGLKYGEIAFLEDGRKLNVVPVNYSESLGNQIIEKTTEFWDRVLAARADMENVHLYEPEPDGTKSYSDFLNKKYSQSEANTIQGADDLKQKAITHKLITEEIKDKEDEARELSNYLKNEMKDFDTISFGTSGKVTWKTDSRGYRTFKNGIKI
jgi:putative phage-type endonuclease